MILVDSFLDRSIGCRVKHLIQFDNPYVREKQKDLSYVIVNSGLMFLLLHALIRPLTTCFIQSCT